MGRGQARVGVFRVGGKSVVFWLNGCALDEAKALFSSASRLQGLSAAPAHAIAFWSRTLQNVL